MAQEPRVVSRRLHLLRRPAAFELTMAGILLLVFAAVFVQHVRRLRAFAEEIAFRNTVGVLRDAVGMKLALSLGKGDVAQVVAWAGRNPMRLLVVPPRNYVGVVNGPRSRRIKPGTWYFDRTDRMLVYRPADARGLRTSLRPKRVRWQLRVVVRHKGGKEQVVGLRLVPSPPYIWHLRNG